MPCIFTKKLSLKNFLYFGIEPDLTYYQNLSAAWCTFPLQDQKAKNYPKKFLIFFQKTFFSDISGSI